MSGKCLIYRPFWGIMRGCIAATLAAGCLAGCGVGRVTYPSPSVAAPAPKYLYWVRPTDGGRELSSAPTGVEFDVSGLRIEVAWSSRVAYVTPENSPGPICTRDKAVVLVPPIPWIFTTDRGTEHFEIELVLTGEGASIDPAQAVLTSSSGKSFRAHSAVDDRYSGPGHAWRLLFEAPCIPDGVYELLLGGITKNGEAVTVPPVRFTPGSDWYFGGP